MTKMLMFGQEEHRELCYHLAHFEDFGAMPVQQARELVEDGYLQLKEVHVLPFSASLTVIELTPKGLSESKKLRKLWDLVYEPDLKSSDWVMQDLYDEQRGTGVRFSLSLERFEKEKKAGRLNEVIASCPPLQYY